MKVTLLGIDYGEARVGLALATTPLAEPLEVVKTDKAVSRVVQTVAQYQVEAIVIGLSEAETASKTYVFAKSLQKVIKLPIYFQDETLSTQETLQKLIQGGTKKSKRREPTDHYVAASILQDFIDLHLPLDELPKADTMA